MALDFEHKGAIGLVLMLVGALGFIPAIYPVVDGTVALVTVPAVIVLTLGTYLLGTDIQGRPV